MWVKYIKLISTDFHEFSAVHVFIPVVALLVFLTVIYINSKTPDEPGESAFWILWEKYRLTQACAEIAGIFHFRQIAYLPDIDMTEICRAIFLKRKHSKLCLFKIFSHFSLDIFIEFLIF